MNLLKFFDKHLLQQKKVVQDWRRFHVLDYISAGSTIQLHWLEGSLRIIGWNGQHVDDNSLKRYLVDGADWCQFNLHWIFFWWKSFIIWVIDILIISSEVFFCTKHILKKVRKRNILRCFKSNFSFFSINFSLSQLIKWNVNVVLNDAN